VSSVVQVGKTESAAAADRDLLSALAGHEAGRERVVAHRARRVVSASWGLMKEQSEGRKIIRHRAMAVCLMALLAVGPFIWLLTDDLIGGEHLADTPAQFSLLVCVLCPTLVAAVLVAGWMRRT